MRKILVSNDDSLDAPGLATLVLAIKDLGEIYVVAPDSAQSGMGHAITINNMLTLKKQANFPNVKEAYSCSGTPADCVKIGLREIMPAKPDLVVSGINHGSNASINVIYSGTMSAAIEAGIEGIPAIGFSYCNYSWEQNMEHIIPYIQTIVKVMLDNKSASNTILNVNFPDIDAIKGVKICRQAKANWEEKFDKRINPMGKEYYWLSGEFVPYEKSEDTDLWALENGYVSVVPVKFDITDYNKIDELKNMNL
jgi:5'-nucleotidase